MNWRLTPEVTRGELSRSTDPQEMYAVFAARMAQLFPVSQHLTISRELRQPDYRVARFSQWENPVNPWKEQHRLPIHNGGLLAELLYGDQPAVIDKLNVDPDDPAAEYFAGQRSLLAIPHFDNGIAQTMVIITRDDTDTFPREGVADLMLLSNLFARDADRRTLDGGEGGVRRPRLRTSLDRGDSASLLPAEKPRVRALMWRFTTRPRSARRRLLRLLPLPNDRLGVLIADASGHDASRGANGSSSQHRPHAARTPAAAGRVPHVHERPPDARYTRPTGSFMTAFYAVFDPMNATLSYASAGHNPPRCPLRYDGFKLALNRGSCRWASSRTRCTSNRRSRCSRAIRWCSSPTA